MDEIKLSQLLNIDKSEYKDWTICLNNAPKDWDTDQYVYSFEENSERLLTHISWHKSKDKKKAFRSIYTKYCLQFIRLDKDSKWDQWLFLGAFENKGTKTRDDGCLVYNLEKYDRFNSFNERLVIRYKRHQGDTQVKLRMELLDELSVVKVLEKPYVRVDTPFPGYDTIRLSFSALSKIIKSNVDNWRELLSNINGVYVITDTSNGKLYVGSTYGKEGVWQRWSCYVYTNGHGGDEELIPLIKEDPNYAIKNFQFTLIETFLNTNDQDKHIQERERYWKDVFDSCKHGYNGNR